MDDKIKIINRLKRIQGQLAGIERMIGEERFCGDIMTQISASRAALNKVSGLIMENYIKNCLVQNDSNENSDVMINELVDIIIKYTK